MDGLVAMPPQHPRDRLERDAPALEPLELRAKLRRTHRRVLALELEDRRHLVLTETLPRVRRSIRGPRARGAALVGAGGQRRRRHDGARSRVLRGRRHRALRLGLQHPSAQRLGRRADGLRARSRPRVELRAVAERTHFNRILAYIPERLNNGRTEGTNGKIRTITRRSYGFHSATNLIAMIFLCCSGIALQPVLKFVPGCT
jgi:hypothetical protein